MSNWILIAASKHDSFVAQTRVNNDTLVYRAISKWLLRGGASKILKSMWEYIDQEDNELEEALLDQLLTQAETQPDDPQITNVKTKDYSIDMSVHAKSTGDSFKSCRVEFVGYVYFHSLKKKMRIDEQVIDLTVIRSDGDVEKIVVTTPTKTPAHGFASNRRVKKRSSKVTPA